MFITLSGKCIQNLSNWHALFVLFCFVFFFITFCSSCGMEWDTARRPTNDLFWAIFIIWASSAPPPPKQYLLSLVSLKYIIIYIDLGIHLKKDNHLGPLPRAKRFYLRWKAFDLLYKMRYILWVVGLLGTCDVTNNGRHLDCHLGFYQELEIRLKPWELVIFCTWDENTSISTA